MWKRLGVGFLALMLVLLIALVISGLGLFGRHEGGDPTSGARRPAEAVSNAAARQARALAEQSGPTPDKQILFGDLHVHTTLSMDAFALSLPIATGEGAHPPADACDFARFCSALDFWSINDHAEGYTPAQWRETVETIRECNATSGPGEPDTVAFLGWEWTQVGRVPSEHYGHKNVVLKGLDDDEIPTRPISSAGVTARAMQTPGILVRGAIALYSGSRRFHDLARYLEHRTRFDPCPEGVHVKDLPNDCREEAATPEVLFRKLDEWGNEALVIPHGTTWGFYTPPGSSWRKQLTTAQHDPRRQTLFEIYSGHGNGEPVRDYRAVLPGPDGRFVCPEASPGYLPPCVRAGQIVHGRCLEEGRPEDECDDLAARARDYAANAGVAHHVTVKGESVDDWLDAGQCRDCDFKPSFNYRPGGSAQYVLALRNPEEDADHERFRFGFIGSSDNHYARPGTGYKEFARLGMTESRDGGAGKLIGPRPEVLSTEPEPFDVMNTETLPFQLVELERQSSFFTTGGLAAVHADGRSREAIWDALERREVYATSGPRILLHFDLVNGPDGERKPMGASTRLSENPRFSVRAVGSLEQLEGCPDYADQALSPERLERLCKGECYNPGGERRLITRIEVVRVYGEESADDAAIGSYVEDPWLRFDCPADPAGCRVEFEDPDFLGTGRDAAYYVRAIEEPRPAINAANLSCERDEAGECVRVHRCGVGDRVGIDCLAPAEERAWSSPIYVDHQR